MSNLTFIKPRPEWNPNEPKPVEKEADKKKSLMEELGLDPEESWDDEEQSVDEVSMSRDDTTTDQDEVMNGFMTTAHAEDGNGPVSREAYNKIKERLKEEIQLKEDALQQTEAVQSAGKTSVSILNSKLTKQIEEQNKKLEEYQAHLKANERIIGKLRDRIDKLQLLAGVPDAEDDEEAGSGKELDRLTSRITELEEQLEKTRQTMLDTERDSKTELDYIRKELYLLQQRRYKEENDKMYREEEIEMKRKTVNNNDGRTRSSSSLADPTHVMEMRQLRKENKELRKTIKELRTLTGLGSGMDPDQSVNSSMEADDREEDKFVKLRTQIDELQEENHSLRQALLLSADPETPRPDAFNGTKAKELQRILDFLTKSAYVTDKMEAGKARELVEEVEFYQIQTMMELLNSPGDIAAHRSSSGVMFPLPEDSFGEREYKREFVPPLAPTASFTPDLSRLRTSSVPPMNRGLSSKRLQQSTDNTPKIRAPPPQDLKMTFHPDFCPVNLVLSPNLTKASHRGSTGTAAVITTSSTASRWSIKLKNSSNLFVGVAPATLRLQGDNYLTCGFYVYLLNGKKFWEGGDVNGQPYSTSTRAKANGVNTVIEVFYDRQKGDLSFSRNSQSLGLAYTGLPGDLYPAFDFPDVDCEIELIDDEIRGQDDFADSYDDNQMST